MTASADKVQFLLENSLEQTLPLVKKGIFSEQQLRQIMLNRQKHQNKLYSSTYKLSHYLKAIEFEYDLERQRLYRIKNQEEENVNPLFRKQGKTDFSVVKRIIKLWDRTMHKYRFRTYLWKQYLSFCIIIKSKKHFYKALTNALRFLPFELELWKIGVRYEVQIGRNLWKARKLFHKAFKLIHEAQKNIQITKELVKFQLQFVETLQNRQKIIQGQHQEDKSNMKFILGENKEQAQSLSQQNQDGILATKGTSEVLNLKEYHQIIFVALVDSISKNYKSKTYFQTNENLSAQERSQHLCDLYAKFLSDLLENQENQLIIHILQASMQKLIKYKKDLLQIKLEEKYEEEKELIVEVEELQDVSQAKQEELQNVMIQQKSQNELRIEEEMYGKDLCTQNLCKEEIYANQILTNYHEKNFFDEKKFVKTLKELCLKPLRLSSFLKLLLPHFLNQSVEILRKNQWLRVPLKGLEMILRRINRSIQQGTNLEPTVRNYLSRQFQKVNPTQYISHVSLLKEVIRFNKQLGKIQENNKLFRSLLVNCKQNIEFVERAKGLFVM